MKKRWARRFIPASVVLGFATLACPPPDPDPPGAGPSQPVAPDAALSIRDAGLALDAAQPDVGSPDASPDMDAGDQPPSLSPEAWPPGELEEFSRRQRTFHASQPAETSDRGMVSGTTSALAVRVGLEALNKGGSAADAVLATAFSQVVLTAGSYVSFAGIAFATCFDARSQEVFYINGGYNTPLLEDDPMSIPAQGSGVPSGRTALVPGFFAGAEALHQKAGVLPWATLLAPAISFASRGFQVDAVLGSSIRYRKDVLARLEETRAIFTHADGTFYRAGEWFKQPALAGTLERIAADGANHIYRGQWAEHFVTAVQREGGRITMDDMTRYQVVHSPPVQTVFAGYQVVAPGLPSWGGMNTVEALNVLTAAGFPERGHYTTAGETFFWFSQVLRLFALDYYDAASLAQIGQGLDLSPASRTTMETARGLWRMLQDGQLPVAQAPMHNKRGSHSDGVVAADAQGNVCALTHSINTTLWGETGLFVDGISIPDSASFQQPSMVNVGPGNRLPEETNPLVVLKDGAPRLVTSSIGMTHQKTMSVLYNWLVDPRGLEHAASVPGILFPDWYATPVVERVVDGDFEDAVLDGARAMGLPIQELSGQAAQGWNGYLVGIEIHPEGGTPRYTGITATVYNGAVLGQ